MLDRMLENSRDEAQNEVEVFLAKKLKKHEDENKQDEETKDSLTYIGEVFLPILDQVDTAGNKGVLLAEEMLGVDDDVRKKLLKDLGRGPVCNHHNPCKDECYQKVETMLIHGVSVAHLHNNSFPKAT